MNQNKPHFLLFSSALRNGDEAAGVGRWHFVLESVVDGEMIEASDEEPGSLGERLELLAVVRGLEALDQPSRVTLVTCSRQISRGFRFGLENWRTNGWQWERFGRLVPVSNADLWRRIDRALGFHMVSCRTLRVDVAHDPQIELEQKPEKSIAAQISAKSQRFSLSLRHIFDRFFPLPLIHRSAV